MRAQPDLRRRRTSIAATSVALTIVLGLDGRRSHAQSAEAQALFDDGNRLMAEGKLDEACGAFDASNRLDPRAGTLILLGECRKQNHQLASAWSAYREALARVKDPWKRAFAQQQIAALEPLLSHLTVVVSDDSRLDGLAITRDDQPFDDALWNRPVPLDGGDHVIAVQAHGYETWRITAQVPVERGQIRVNVPRLVERSQPELAPPPGPAPSRSEPVPPRSEPVSPLLPRTPGVASSVDRDAVPVPIVTRRRAIGLGVAAAGVGVAIAGVVFGESARNKQREAVALCPDGPECENADAANARIDAGHRRALEANIAFGVAVAAVIGAGALWFTGAPARERPRRVTVLPALAPGQAGIVVMGRL
jgi:hypothetical protein